MTVFTCILLLFLIVCAIAASLSKNLLNTILIFLSYSLVISVIWILLESPDLAITEAAVGAGVTTVLFLVTLKKIHAIIREDEANKQAEEAAKNSETRADSEGITVAAGTAKAKEEHLEAMVKKEENHE